MKLKELISQLEKYDQELDVWLNDSSGNCNPVEKTILTHHINYNHQTREMTVGKEFLLLSWEEK